MFRNISRMDICVARQAQYNLQHSCYGNFPQIAEE